MKVLKQCLLNYLKTMTNNFQECPFYLDEIKIHSIYRSLSPGNFFITFKEGGTISKPIIVETPYNPFNEYICSCSTVWHPEFEAMKVLLVLGVKVKEELDEEQRKKILENKEDVFTFGTYDFNEDCKHTLVDGKYTFKRKTYYFVIDNIKETIKIAHSKSD